jgi:hypothetical protein
MNEYPILRKFARSLKGFDVSYGARNGKFFIIVKSDNCVPDARLMLQFEGWASTESRAVDKLSEAMAQFRMKAAV